MEYTHLLKYNPLSFVSKPTSVGIGPVNEFISNKSIQNIEKEANLYENRTKTGTLKGALLPCRHKMKCSPRAKYPISVKAPNSVGIVPVNVLLSSKLCR